jgi:hypothetical protein
LINSRNLVKKSRGKKSEEEADQKAYRFEKTVEEKI